MKKGSLKQAFANSAPVGFFIRNSATLSSWPFALGYAAMILKGGLHPDLDTAAGVLMIGASIGFTMQNKFPNAAFRVSALMGASAALCLSAKGFDFNTMEIANKWRFIAPLTGPLIANTMIGFQKEIAGFSQKHVGSENKLVRAFAKAGKYPLLAAATVDLTNGGNLIMAAVSEKDWMFLGAIGAFAVGEFGLIASDPRLREAHKAMKAGKPLPGI